VNLSTAKALWAFERGCAIESQAGKLVRQSKRIWHSWWLFEYFFAAEKSIVKI